MGDLKTENTSYPSQLDSATALEDDVTEIVAQLINGPNSAIIALEAELGIGVKGTAADLAARLAVNIADDGGIIHGADFPSSPPLLPHLFYHENNAIFYTYDVSTASYTAIPGAATLADYIRKSTPDTIVAQHTFSPATPGVPFILGANAQGQKVIGLNADQVDGASASATPTASTIPIADGSGKLSAGWGGSVSGLATLDSSSKVVQEPASKAQVSGIASLDSNSLVVQNPANATTTAGASKIPISGSDGVLAEGWSGLLNVQYLTAGTTYTPTTGTHKIIIEMIGGGGAGGGAATTSTGQVSVGGGGNGGSYAKKLFTGISGTYTYAIGQGGTGNTGSFGNAGTDTTFTGPGSVTVTAKGGAAGNYQTATTTFPFVSPLPSVQDISTNGDINTRGHLGSFALGMSATLVYSGAGGNGLFGSGAPLTSGGSGNGLSAATYGSVGSGGSGGINLASQATGRAGGAGANGLIIVWEFS